MADVELRKVEAKELIWQVVAAIPEGKVATYGQIAKAAGLPGYARYVGTTLKNLPKQTKLPWHRVINAQGKVSLPLNSNAYKEQIRRLGKENVATVDGKIDLGKYTWEKLLGKEL